MTAFLWKTIDRFRGSQVFESVSNTYSCFGTDEPCDSEAGVRNGYSAMFSNALGRMASHLMTEDIFPAEYPAGSFQPIFADH